MRKKFALISVAAATALLSSPTANADRSQDQYFWDILIASDVIPGPRAIVNAHSVCAAVWSGEATVWDAVDKIYQQNDVSYLQAQIFVNAAIDVYCPVTSSKVA